MFKKNISKLKITSKYNKLFKVFRKYHENFYNKKKYM